MSNEFDWLPELVLFENYCCKWQDYEEALYAFFKADFLDSRPYYEKQKVNVKRLPISRGKESSFWHLIQEGKIEEERTPDMRRCERIRWPRPIIEQSKNKNISVWKNLRHTKSGIVRSICLWAREKEYAVILREREGYFLFWTAYPVTREHTKNKFRKEYEAYKKAGDAISGDPVTPSTHGR